MMQDVADHLSAASVACRILVGAALALLPGSCGQSYIAPPVTPRLLAASPAPAAMLDRGYLIYQAKCAKCHPFENPARYPAAALTRQIMPAMARKAKLDAGDAQAVLAYVLAARQLPEPAGSR